MKIHQAVFINLDDSEWDWTTDLFDVNEALSRWATESYSVTNIDYAMPV